MIHLILPFFAGLMVLLVSAFAWWHFFERRFTVLTPGEMYRSAAMKPKVLGKVVVRHGIRSVIDLRTETEGDVQSEANALEAVGCRHLHLPSTQVPSDELRDRFLEMAGNPENRPALIHCTHGEGRAVLYGALWLIEFKGMDPECARKASRFLTTWKSTFDPRKAKGAYLRSYKPVRTK